jgi:hypothetical protein
MRAKLDLQRFDGGSVKVQVMKKDKLTLVTSFSLPVLKGNKSNDGFFQRGILQGRARWEGIYLETLLLSLKSFIVISRDVREGFFRIQLHCPCERYQGGEGGSSPRLEIPDDDGIPTRALKGTKTMIRLKDNRDGLNEQAGISLIKFFNCNTSFMKSVEDFGSECERRELDLLLVSRRRIFQFSSSDDVEGFGEVEVEFFGDYESLLLRFQENRSRMCVIGVHIDKDCLTLNEMGAIESFVDRIRQEMRDNKLLFGFGVWEQVEGPWMERVFEGFTEEPLNIRAFVDVLYGSCMR